MGQPSSSWKLVRADKPWFGLSDRFYMANVDDDLCRVLQIFKKLGGLVLE